MDKDTRHFKQMETKKAVVIILISNKGYNKRQRKTLHNDKEINPIRGYNLLIIYTSKTEVPKYIKEMMDIKK